MTLNSRDEGDVHLTIFYGNCGIMRLRILWKSSRPGVKKLVIMALYRSPLTVTLWPSSFLKKYGPMIPPAHKVHQTVSFSGCNGVSTYTCGLASL
ncbi:hypothetical protein TNCV_4584381 [Trichonephila clavipes]|nr:hypothetical protein TNCV_4584381 [Trichonephila clavipes]